MRLHNKVVQVVESNKTKYLVVFDSTTCTILLFLTQRGCRNFGSNKINFLLSVLAILQPANTDSL